jgi:hypothetical protein
MTREAILGAIFAGLILTFALGLVGLLSSRVIYGVLGCAVAVGSVVAFIALGAHIHWR